MTDFYPGFWRVFGALLERSGAVAPLRQKPPLQGVFLACSMARSTALAVFSAAFGALLAHGDRYGNSRIAQKAAL